MCYYGGMKKTDTKPGVKEKRPPRTMKEKKFAYKYLVEQKPAVIAAMETYDVSKSKDPYGTAKVIGSQNLTKLNFEDHFRNAGLTDEVIAQNVALMATGATKRDHFSGEYEPDNHIRLKATDLALKVMGKMPKETGDTTNNIIVTPILGGLTKVTHVRTDDSNRENSEIIETD